MKRHLPDVHAYADDNQLYISFKPGSSASELEAVTALQDCFLDIKTWMTADRKERSKANTFLGKCFSLKTVFSSTVNYTGHLYKTLAYVWVDLRRSSFIFFDSLATSWTCL